MTRREQLGTEDHQLQEKPKDLKGTKPSGKGSGRGRGRGRGRGKPANEKEVENEGGDSGDMVKGNDTMQDDGSVKDDPMDAEGDKISNAEGGGQEKHEKPKRRRGLKRPASKTEKEDEMVKKPQSTAKAEAKAKAKARAKAKAKTSKAKDTKMDETGSSPATSPPVLDPKYQIESATWAGRWVPSDPLQHLRMAAIKKAFDEHIAPKVRRQSAFQSAFFKACNDSFKEKGMDENTPFDDLVSAAEEKVENFLQQESVRYLSLLKSPFF